MDRSMEDTGSGPLKRARRRASCAANPAAADLLNRIQVRSMNLLALVSRATWKLGGLVFLTGCGTMSNGRGWGQDVNMLPSPTHVGHAAWNALTDPWTWVPIAGALVLQVENFDERISDWAQDDAPMFGSSEDAKSARGWTGNASDFVYFSSVAVTPSGDEPLDWAWSKAKGLSVQMSARFVTL